MANELRDHVWVVDTASATLVEATSMRIQTIRWIGATTAGHEAIIKNGRGKIVWASVANAANFLDESHGLDFRTQDGFAVTTLGSGLLYIYLDLTPGA